MGYQSRIGRRRSSGRGYGTPRHMKVKAKNKKRRNDTDSNFEKSNIATTKETVDKILKRLLILGRQRFAISPYRDHFDRWLMNLREILSEFESNPTIGIDDQFVKERSQILLKVELELDERRRKEISLEKPIKSLAQVKILLTRVEEEHASRVKEIKTRRKNEVNRLNIIIDQFREELDYISTIKTGLFRGISKRAKAQKEKDTRQRLIAAQGELEQTITKFNAEREMLRNEYDRKKQIITEKIRDHQREIERLETDSSLEERRVACESLINAVNALLKRKKLKVD